MGLPARRRLALLHRHTATAAASTSAEPLTTPRAQPPPPQSPKLLTDEEMCRFVATGFLSLPLAPTGDPLHAHILERCEQLGTEGEHSAPPNQQQRNRPAGEQQPEWAPPFEVYNVHPRIAGMQQVLHGPILRGALTSILGEDFSLNAHRSVAFGGSSVSTHKVRRCIRTVSPLL